MVVCSGTSARAPFEGVEFVDLFGPDRHAFIDRAELFLTAYYPDYVESPGGRNAPSVRRLRA